MNNSKAVSDAINAWFGVTEENLATDDVLEIPKGTRLKVMVSNAIIKFKDEVFHSLSIQTKIVEPAQYAGKTIWQNLSFSEGALAISIKNIVILFWELGVIDENLKLKSGKAEGHPIGLARMIGQTFECTSGIQEDASYGPKVILGTPWQSRNKDWEYVPGPGAVSIVENQSFVHAIYKEVPEQMIRAILGDRLSPLPSGLTVIAAISRPKKGKTSNDNPALRMALEIKRPEEHKGRQLNVILPITKKTAPTFASLLQATGATEIEDLEDELIQFVTRSTETQTGVDYEIGFYAANVSVAMASQESGEDVFAEEAKINVMEEEL